MSKPTFTPGPWNVLRNGFGVEGFHETDGTSVIAQCMTGGRAVPECRANARLIALAPEMHSLLTRLLRECDLGAAGPRADAIGSEIELLLDRTEVSR